jgi:phosphoribosyl-ATP pyrophosphohydrolase/phosphoribosyl-AMP cyclohydrolase/histidinol dehydrogenase
MRAAAEVSATSLRLPSRQVFETASGIVGDVQREGAPAIRRHAERLGDLAPGAPLMLSRREMTRALASLPHDDRAVLERAAERIRTFALAQRACLKDLDTAVPGGVASHRFHPIESAGCYAPGGRFPLPSSVLMTAVTARAAGVRRVVVASPRPAPITLAAAALADADEFLSIGGAQAIAAMAFGAPTQPTEPAIAPVDMICGPGNQYVTAAKALVFGTVGIDMLAGPSEVLIIADDSADPERIAADLLAQAEHDTDSVPMLVTTSAALCDAVEVALVGQLTTLPTARVAVAALANGFCCIVPDLPQAAALANHLAPEHLQIVTRDAEAVAELCSRYGAIFIGADTAEVFGDYGAGPNHVLPTAGGARFAGGLSVLTFLRCSTSLQTTATNKELARLGVDCARLARLEGLEAHARAAESRVR